MTSGCSLRQCTWLGAACYRQKKPAAAAVVYLSMGCLQPSLEVLVLRHTRLPKSNPVQCSDCRRGQPSTHFVCHLHAAGFMLVSQCTICKNSILWFSGQGSLCYTSPRLSTQQSSNEFKTAELSMHSTHSEYMYNCSLSLCIVYMS